MGDTRFFVITGCCVFFQSTHQMEADKNTGAPAAKSYFTICLQVLPVVK